MSPQRTSAMRVVFLLNLLSIGLAQNNVYNCIKPVCNITCTRATSYCTQPDAAIYCLNDRKCNIDATAIDIFSATVYANNSNSLTLRGCPFEVNIYVQYAKSVQYALETTTQFCDGLVNIMANYTHSLTVTCTTQYCDQHNIYAQHANRVNVLCASPNNQPDADVTGCGSDFVLYANYTRHLSLQATNRSALLGASIYAANAGNVSIECRLDYPITLSYYAWTGTCSNTDFDFSNATFVNFTCFGTYSCSNYDFGFNASSINVRNASDVRFQAVQEFDRWVFDRLAFYILDGRYTQSMNVEITQASGGWDQNDYSMMHSVGDTHAPHASGNFAIFVSELNSTSIYCNGISSCSWLEVYSQHGLANVNMTFTPNCSSCADSHHSFGCLTNYTSVSLFCGAGYTEQSVFGYDAYANPPSFSLCPGVCCEKSKYYVNASQGECSAPTTTTRAPRNSNEKNIIYYAIAGAAALCVIIAVSLVLIVKCRKPKNHQNKHTLSVNDALLKK